VVQRAEQFVSFQQQQEIANIDDDRSRAREKNYGAYDPFGRESESEYLLANQEKIKTRKNVEYSTDDCVAAFGKDLKGWKKTSSDIYTKGSATLTITTDRGGVYGVYNDGTRIYQPSSITFVQEGRLIKQGDMHSYPERVGIGTVLCYEGAMYAKSLGCDTIAVSAINANSEALAKMLDKKVGGSSGCSCPCFLTTACVAARGLPDDCEELTVLRDFRDSYLMQTAERREMVSHYYDVAPAIVLRLQISEDAPAQWERIYQLIRSCVRMIKERRFDQALQVYKRMVEQLTQGPGSIEKNI
jgi:hypothetical protein